MSSKIGKVSQLSTTTVLEGRGQSDAPTALLPTRIHWLGGWVDQKRDGVNIEKKVPCWDINSCKISGYHGGENKDYLVGYCTV